MVDKYSISYSKSDTSYRTMDSQNLIECLEDNKKKKADEEAFVFVSTEEPRQCITWKQLYGRSCLVGKSLINLGVKSKEFVAINLRTCPEWLYATFGSMMAGAIPVSISFTYKDGSDIIALMEKMICCTALVMEPGLDDINWKILKDLLDEYNRQGYVKSSKMPSLKLLLGHAFEHTDTCVKPFQDLLKESPCNVSLPEIAPGDVATLFQTSGSTGLPKLAVFSHQNIVRVAESEIIWLDPRYRCFNDRPFGWLGGFPLSVTTGSTRVTVSGFDKYPEKRLSLIIDTIPKESCSSVQTLPSLLNELFRLQDELPSDWPLEVIMTGGQPITKDSTKGIGKTCQSLYCVYGATETVVNMQCKVDNHENFVDYSCGKLLQLKDLEVKIVDETGEIVPVNTTGELYVRTPTLFREYLNDEKRTRLAKTDDGWYKTDDIGVMNVDGEFFVKGRKSNIIISGGMNVTPEILEQALKKLPCVESVGVVPVPDLVAYQVVCACVIRKAGSQITEEQLRKLCEEHHADKPGLFTVLPKYYTFVDKFPKTSTGKINRKALEKMAEEIFRNAYN